MDEKDWLAGELSVKSLRGKVIVDTGAGVNITTIDFAKKVGAKITVGPKMRMTFADGRESSCNLQSEMEFMIGEVKSKATFRLISNLLPGMDLSATDLLALATILAMAVAMSTVTSEKSASIPSEFQQFAGTPPVSVYVKSPVEPPAVHVSVVGAKAMHKTLKVDNELTALLFVGGSR